MRIFLLYFYVIGMVVAFICGCIEAYLEHKEGKNIDDAPACISVMTITSWFYVYIFFANRFFNN